MMEAQDELKLELMHARTELVFLLSDQVPGQASEIRNVRRQINQLVEAINGNRYRILSGAPVSAQMKAMDRL
jgi:ribosomal protein L29